MSDSDAYDPTQRTPLSAEEKQARAVARKADANAAMDEYRADEEATRQRTVKLRAQRLERQKSMPAMPQPERPTGTKKK
jgi:hypothetical protein